MYCGTVLLFISCRLQIADSRPPPDGSRLDARLHQVAVHDDAHVGRESARPLDADGGARGRVRRRQRQSLGAHDDDTRHARRALLVTGRGRRPQAPEARDRQARPPQVGEHAVRLSALRDCNVELVAQQSRLCER